MSEDSTLEIVARIANSFEHIEVIQVRNCNNTHKFVEKYWYARFDLELARGTADVLQLPA